MENRSNLIDGLPLGTAQYAAQPYLLPNPRWCADDPAATALNPRQEQTPVPPSTVMTGLTILTDPAVAQFAEITPSTIANLALASSHAERLEPISNGLIVPDPQDLQRLLTSTRIIADIFVNSAALLNLLINRANHAAFLLRLPREILQEIFFILAVTAPPALRRWDNENLGWLALYWTCTDIRMAMKGTAVFWAMVCTQLPRAHQWLRALACNVPLVLEVSAELPALPATLSYGTIHDKRRMANLLKVTPAFFYSSITIQDMRICPTAALKWMATTGGIKIPGLPYLTRLVLEAPPVFDDRNESETVTTYALNALERLPLSTPTLSTVILTNIYYPFISSSLTVFKLTFDLCPDPDCPRPTLSIIITALSRSQGSLKEIVLFNAIDDDQDEIHIATTLRLRSLTHLYINQPDSDIVNLCLSRFRVPTTCNIQLGVTMNSSSTTSVPSQLHELFHLLLCDQPRYENRLLRIRNLGVRRDYARTEICWTFDSKDTYRISDWTWGSKAVVLKTPNTTSWLSCLRMFAETLVTLHYPPVKTLVLPVAQKAWEIRAHHEVDAEIACTLFILGKVQYVWPLTRVSWALATNSAMRVPDGHPAMLRDSFHTYLEEMRRAKAFDMLRLQ